jgi:2-hydroxychromene-2-carboxylate isomerase
VTERNIVDFWFDPICPWAWMTSRWMTEVEQLRPVEVRWHVMSLAVLNEGRSEDRWWGPARVVNAARERHGEPVVKPLYDALGTRIHPGGSTDYPQVIDEALAEVGLPAELARFAASPEYDAQLRASHEAGIKQVGMDVGTPIVAVNGKALFGPVVSPAPRGEAAAKLWDGVLLVTATDGFYELKRTRDRGPQFA